MHIVLLPGLPGVGWLFGPLLQKLPPWLSPVVVSYPTDRPLGYDELVKFVRGKIPRSGRFLLLGDSFSGPVAIRLASEAPERLAGVILTATFATNPLPRIFRPLRWLIRPVLFSTDTPRSLVRRWLLSSDASDQDVEFIARATDVPSPRVMAHRIRGVLKVDVRRELAAIQVPILYFRGKHDRVVQDRACRAMAAVRPDITIVEIDGPHILLLRNIPEIVAAIEQFVEPLRPVRG